ncbi:MAG: hypothetical protein AAF825_07550, partial [Pseudomonadota bacterium]
PGHAWPEIDTLARSCAAAGFALEERLTIYPRFLDRAEHFVSPGLRAPLAAMARADGMAQDQALDQAQDHALHQAREGVAQ